MRIQLILDPRLPPERLTALGLLAEAEGIRGVWTSSLLGACDPFVAFAPLAQASSKLLLGPIAVNPFEAHPTRIAAALLTLNQLSQGRAQIVIGGGAEALASLGIAPARRVIAVRECVELLRLAARGKIFDYEGQLYRAQRFGCEWATAKPPSIWIAANGPQMLAMAAAQADGIMVSDLPPPVLRSVIHQANSQRGATLPSLECSNFVAWHVYPDLTRARDEARRWLAYRGLNRRWVCTTFMSDAEFDLIEARMPDFYRYAQGGPPVTGIPDELLDRLVDNLTLTGQPERLEPIVEHLQHLRDSGLTQVALRLYQDVEQSIKLIGRTLVPRFT